MSNPFLPPAVPLPSLCPPPAVPLRLTLLLLCLLLLLTACGRRPGQPTPLPAGTRVAQNTPDFSAPAQAETPTQTADQVADSLRARLARQQTQTVPTAPRPSPSPPPPLPSPHPSLAVFSRPTALGILSGGGQLYSAPGAGVVANLQIGATLTITGRSADGGWFAAYLADGIAGWVPAAQVRVFGDAGLLEIVQESIGPAAVATLIAEASKPQDPHRHRRCPPDPRPTPAPPPPLPFPRNNRPRSHHPRRRRQRPRRTRHRLPRRRRPLPKRIRRPPRPQPNRRLAPNRTPRWPRLDLRAPRPNHRPHRRTPIHRPSSRPRTLANPLTAPNIAPAQITAIPPSAPLRGSKRCSPRPFAALRD